VTTLIAARAQRERERTRGKYVWDERNKKLKNILSVTVDTTEGWCRCCCCHISNFLRLLLLQLLLLVAFRRTNDGMQGKAKLQQRKFGFFVSSSTHDCTALGTHFDNRRKDRTVQHRRTIGVSERERNWEVKENVNRKAFCSTSYQFNSFDGFICIIND
jgi:hypothetical protein